MKIALIVDRYSKKGGAEGYLARLAKSLENAGGQAALFSMDDPEDFPGKRIRVAGRGLPRGFRELYFSKACAAAVEKEGCDLSLAVRHAAHADIFQPHGGTLFDSQKAQQECRGGGRPGPSLFSASNVKRRALRHLEKQLVKNCRRILCLSSNSQREFSDLYPSYQSKIFTLALGIDRDCFEARGERIDFRKQLGGSENARFLLFAAHDFELKGLATALGVLADLRRRGAEVQLVIAGRGRNLPRWKKEVARLDLAGSVHFLGEISHLAPYYRSADLLLHPTFYDPCSTVVLEALSCGLPALTTSRNGASQAAGPLLQAIGDPRNVEAWTRAAIFLMDSKDRRHPAKYSLPEEWSWESHFKNLMQNFQELLQRKTNPDP